MKSTMTTPEQKPSIGRIVHYVSRGSADGVFTSECRAAIITSVADDANIEATVFNPTGVYFHQLTADHDEKCPGSWHWPERA